MNRKMTEPEIVSGFEEALQFGHIYIQYQPQFNHSTGRMIGAEALIRWKHPALGDQYPADFIPVLEKNNLIYRADLFVFEQVCVFQRKCLDEGISPVPISVNMSRYDIYDNNYVDEIEEIRKKYDVPVKYLRIEITESSAIGGIELISNVVSKLHGYGYLVEMDDFGSGYSSLNILKDLDVDIIKLDMLFMSKDMGGRGGIILSSIVHMAKWLKTPVLAEGVESVEQAEYLRSIGCNYIQGYLYSKAVSEADFVEKLKTTDHEPVTPPIQLIEHMDADKFWNPKSLETLIFSNYVGAAAIFTYEEGRVELLRINDKYSKELGMNMTEKDILGTNPLKSFDQENKDKYQNAMELAIASNDEVVTETWRTIVSDCCGEDRICIRSTLRVIGSAGNQYLFYVMIQNITAEKKRFADISENEIKLRFASDQANVYAWEYTIANKQMRPCFRCMRDLGLPPVLKNYPEPVIENGLFPPDYADMYRDMMRQIDEGVGSIEAIIPLTVGRIPFHVRYTTEFDENGKPLKAYGSATLVINEAKNDGEEK
ncbi:MAG TPA: hypothetical protein DEO87_08800 [Lachnospiraceae bacterium]|nr:hypothetical protein [Lachnospiraceae bacterium]